MTNTEMLLRLKNLYVAKAVGMVYEDDHITPSFADTPDISTIREICRCVSECQLCDISKTRIKSVCGQGETKASLLIINEFPTRTIESSNKYYSDNSGEMLKNIIERIFGLKTKDIYLTFAIKCRPPESRAPTPSEILACRGYLLKEIELVCPKVILAMGELSYLSLSEDKSDFNKIRGNVLKFGNYNLVASYSQMQLLKNPSLKEDAKKDFLKVKELL